MPTMSSGSNSSGTVPSPRPVTMAAMVVALLDEVFRADRVVETLAEGDVAELDAVESGVGCHGEPWVN
jgi:hypothetical protein